MMCSFPGYNHPWAQCFANPHGTNYRPNYNPLGRKTNHQGNKGNTCGSHSRGVVYMVEMDTDEASSPNTTAA